VTASAIEGATSGLNHVTGITAEVQANIDFYVGFLGARRAPEEQRAALRHYETDVDCSAPLSSNPHRSIAYGPA
jgi:catechol 2,3-dioxygenase-like lactoylglutathione lyase family enzyme